ncbi:MAG TPA: hypothetical protein DCG32_02285 [Sphaerochaeta sp.]|jgi:fructose-specific phosphotransferase system IIC component|nr:hypothetical protein [Sphaerochaeta sp.]
MDHPKYTEKILIIVALVFALTLLMTACLPGTLLATEDKPAGFFMGIWHGWIAPISLIVGIFDPSVRIYEQNNSGWLYDFGFYIAIISGFGGLSLARRKGRRRN